MKRPEGFDGQAANGPADPPRSRSAQGKKPADRAKARPSPFEPLPTPAGSASSYPTASSEAETGPIPLPSEYAPASTFEIAAPAVARRKLRKAARARRRFEKAEVRRFTRRSRRRKAAWVTVAAVVATLGAILAVAVYSPILALRDITVDGTSKVDTSAVIAAVDGQLGTPLALINFDAIRGELKQFPLIRSYVTETVPPNTLRIHIVEREPIATLQRGNSFEEVDPAGIVISSSPERQAIPLIDIGTRTIKSAAFTSAVAVLLAMPDSVIEKVDTITAKTPDDVTVTLHDTTPRVLWGSARDSEIKAQVLAVMLARPECAPLAVIDVSAPLAPICGPE